MKYDYWNDLIEKLEIEKKHKKCINASDVMLDGFMVLLIILFVGIIFISLIK